MTIVPHISNTNSKYNHILRDSELVQKNLSIIKKIIPETSSAGINRTIAPIKFPISRPT